jgi:tetratricopeptide (TPR) repeat protein
MLRKVISLVSRKGHSAKVKNSSRVQINQADVINQYINQKKVEIPKFLTNPPLRNSHFMGREDKVQELVKRLELDGAVTIMNGWGGIGKTTIASEYYFRNIDKYDHLAWIRIAGTLEETMLNSVLIAKLGIEIDPKEELAVNARIVKNHLINLKGNHLMVLDNANDIKDIQKHKDLLPQINWKVLITTRGQIQGFPHIRIDVLDLEYAKSLFYKHYRFQRDEPELERFLQTIGRHTLAIELMAKIANNGGLSIGELTGIIKKEGFSSPNLGLDLTSDYDSGNIRIKEIFAAAFNYSAILKDDKKSLIFKHFILMPSIPISLKVFSEMTQIDSSIETRNALNMLVASGWLQDEAVEEEIYIEKRFSLHPLLAETTKENIDVRIQDVERYLNYIAGKLKIDNYENPLKAAEWLDYGSILTNYFVKSDDPVVSILQNNLALIHKYLGEYGQARNLMEKALASDRRNFGEDHPSTSIRFSNLATIYQDLGEYSQARDLMEKALSADRKNFGEDHPNTAISCSNLALIYQDLGEYGQARDLMEKALASDRTNFGEDHPSTTIRCSNLAMIYKDKGEYGKARELMEEALASNRKNFGEDHPDTARSCSNLAMIYKDLGEYGHARDLMEKALESDRKNFGEGHPSTAIKCSNLALIHKVLGEYGQARELMEKALVSNRKNFGEDHPSTAISCSNLATIYQDQGEFGPAQDLMKKALESDLKNFGEDHPNTALRYSNLAMIYKDMGQYIQARDLMEKALESDLKNFGEDHPNTTRRFSNLAMIYRDMGEFNQARDLMEKALESDRKNFGEDHPSTAINYSNFALIYKDLGVYGQAREKIAKAYLTARKIWGDVHPSTKIIKNNLDDIG